MSLSPGPALVEQAWHYELHANMWRITDDFWDHWDSLKDMFHRCALWQDHVKTGCYPDCDMLPLGFLGKGFGSERTTNFTREEQRTMLTLWCLFGSPLMLGCEMTKMDDWTLSLLTTRKILGLLTPDCKPHLLQLNDTQSIWTAYNKITKEYYTGIFNLQDTSQEFSISSETIGFPQQTDSLVELWTGTSYVLQDGNITVTIPAHGTMIFQCI